MHFHIRSSLVFLRSVNCASSPAPSRRALFTEGESALGYREPPYYIRPVNETRGDALKLLRELRAGGVAAEMDFEARSMKAQLKRADRVQAAIALIEGGDELARGEVTLRDMRKSEQRAVARADVLETVRASL